MCLAHRFLEQDFGLLRKEFRRFDVAGVAVARETCDGDSPVVLDGRIDLDAGIEDGHFLDRPHDAHRVLVPPPLEVLVGKAPARRARRPDVGERIRQGDELVRQQAAAANARIAVIEVAEGDAGPGSQPVVEIRVDQSVCARVGVPLQVSPDPIVVVARPMGKQFRAGVQQQSSGLGGRGGNDDHVGGLHVQPAGGVEIPHSCARPWSSTMTSLTTDSVRSSQWPVASATGITVFCVPFLASIGQAKPTQLLLCTQARRPP